MLSRIVRRRLATTLRSRAQSTRQVQQRRWNTPAPRPGDGPLMSRRADRELPEIDQIGFRWRRTLPLFAVIVTACSLAIFNYQKMSSPVVSSTLYALRTSPTARAILGDEVYFKHQIPWIRGTLNQMQGRIDIWFTVKGSRGTATMRFSSNRPTHRGVFETTEWSLVTEDGKWVDLLEGGDPFKSLTGADVLIEEDDDDATRGFRQQGNAAR